MAGLSTKDIKTGGGLPKIIEPGQHVLKINNVKLERHSFMEADQGYYMLIDVETKPIEGFEGFFKDSKDESLGKYDGQIGQVKTNKFYYKDSVTKSGIEIARDTEILKQIKNLCSACGQLAWFDKADGVYQTIEDFVEAFNKEKPFKDIFLKFCIAGKEYNKKNTYIGHDLFLPKVTTKGCLVYEAENAKVSKILPFDEAIHIIPLSETDVAEFDGTAETTGTELPTANSKDLSGAPDFEL